MDIRPIYIIGSGGHAESSHACMRAMGLNCDGCISNVPFAGELKSIPWLGDDHVLSNLDPSSVYLVNGIGSVGRTLLRQFVFEMASAKGFEFLTLIHPTAIVEFNVSLAEGCQIFAGSILQAGSAIGKNCLINSGAIIEHGNRIGDHCHVASGARLSGNVVLEAGTHVGTGACIIQDVKIGPSVIVGAGSVVLRDIPGWDHVVGTPARSIRRLSGPT